MPAPCITGTTGGSVAGWTAVSLHSPSSLQIDEPVKEIYNQLHKLIEKRTRYSLHSKFLEIYQRDNLVPQGLLLKKELLLKSQNIDIDQQWNSTLQSASHQLRDIALCCANEKVQELDNQIDALKSSLFENTGPALYHTILNQVNRQTNSLYDHLHTSKLKKLEKDRNVYTHIDYPDDHNTTQQNSRSPGTQRRHSRRYKRTKYGHKRKATKRTRDNNTPASIVSFLKSTINDDTVTNSDHVLQLDISQNSSHLTSSSQTINTSDGPLIDNPQSPDMEKKSIINMSKVTLDPAQESLLDKGLGYCPVPPKVDSLQLRNDIKAFCRRMRLKAHFSKEIEDDCQDENPLPRRPNLNYPKSTWNPPTQDYNLELYLDRITNDITNLTISRRRPADNLTSDERHALRSLRNNRDIVIKPADKGGSIVIMDRDFYIAEGDRQLSDTTTYKRVDKDPTKRHLELVSKTVSKAKLDVDIKSALPPTDCKCPNLYLLPKVHKIGTPGRPIVSGCNCPTAQISRLLDFYLKPLAQQTDSYIQDTTHFINFTRHLNRTHSPFPNNTLICTADVKSLYTNICHQEGLQACQQALETRQIKDPPTQDLVRMMELVLTLNNFQFDGQFYVQLSGTAMGTPAAVSYAILFMDFIERKMIQTAPSKPSHWKRYIDDVFYIWENGIDELKVFQDHLNTYHSSIKFTFESSDKQVPFLDVMTYLSENQLTTSLFFKPTDAHNYLHPVSCHPPHTFNSIVYSQALRIRRICSEDVDRETQLRSLRHHFVERQYPPEQVDIQIDKAREIERDNLLKYKEKKRNNRVPFVVTYSPFLKGIGTILHKHLPLLHNSPKLKQIFPEPPLPLSVAHRTYVIFSFMPRLHHLPQVKILQVPSSALKNVLFVLLFIPVRSSLARLRGKASQSHLISHVKPIGLFI